MSISVRDQKIGPLRDKEINRALVPTTGKPRIGDGDSKSYARHTNLESSLQYNGFENAAGKRNTSQLKVDQVLLFGIPSNGKKIEINRLYQPFIDTRAEARNKTAKKK